MKNLLKILIYCLLIFSTSAISSPDNKHQPYMSLENLAVGHDTPNDVNVVIEIPAHSDPIKYEFDKKSGMMVVDRFLSTSMHYPFNYGFIPHTLSEDGDPLDVLVITPF